MKKIISIIIALTMLLSTVSVFASSNIGVNMLDVNLLDSVIKVKLDQAEKGEKILLVVTNPGYEDNAADIKNAVQNYNSLTADEEGKTEYSFKLYAPMDGLYRVYANGTEVAKFTYDVVAMKTVVETIAEYAKNNNKTDLQVYIQTTAALEGLALETFEPLVNAQVGLDMGKVTDALIAEINKNTFTGSDKENGSKMQNIIKTVVALELFNQKIADQYIYNNDGSLIHDSALALSKIDASKSVTLYDYYLNGYNDASYSYVLTDAGKATVKAALKGENFVSTEDLYQAFMKAVVCAGVNNSTVKGSTGSITYGYIKGLLTTENKAATGVTGNVSTVAKKLAGTTTAIKDIAELNKLIAQYEKGESQQNSTVSGGSPSGGGVGAVSPSGTMVVTPVDNVDIAKQNDKNANENAKDTFSDMAGVEWALDAIETLAEKGIINGVGDGKFDPQGTVTREQFVKMLCVALNLTEEAEINFTDIAADDWSVPYIRKAVKAGLISGVDENTFGYGVGISRQDIAVILHRTLKDSTGTASFSDAGEIADYAKDAVGALTGLKILNGFEDGSFKPGASCTRAQAAVIIYNYLNR